MVEQVTWRWLNANAHSMTEHEFQKMLEDEMVGARRPDILRRLHQRYSALRTARERDTLMALLGIHAGAQERTEQSRED
jgi:hypothetical protein